MLPGPSIFASLSLAFWLSGAKFRPAEEKASISRPRLPPDSDTAARRAALGGSAWTKHSVVSIISSRPTHADHAFARRDGVEGFDRARERAGMRHRRGASAFGRTELERDHRLAGGARGLAGFAEDLGVPHAFEIDHDHANARDRPRNRPSDRASPGRPRFPSSPCSRRRHRDPPAPGGSPSRWRRIDRRSRPDRLPS